MKSEQPHESLKIDNHHISRRSFLGTTAAGSAALLTGGLATLFKERAFAGSSFPFVEATIPQLQAAMTNGQLTSKDLTMGYLNRIASLNPTLHAVIETNANAVSIASSLDNERSHGMVRGPLHGIPILVKDNIATLDNMQTTAGSVAIYGNQVPADAPLIQNLRAAAVGTETDGSITGPSAVENIFGLKPTLGLISQDGIVPISHQQDTAGPMARSVTDVAILLGIMQSPQTDYTPLLKRGALKGKRIGRDVRFFDYSYFGSGIPGDEETVAFANHALDVMHSLGAKIVDTDTGDVFAYTSDEFTALLYEFRAQIADYLATLTHTTMRTLVDLIAFNDAHCPQELVYYDQDVFLLAEQFVGYPNDPNYTAARNHATSTARAGIDGAMTRDHLDAIVAPHLTNSTGPAVAGYPNFSMPVGIRSSGRPAGMLMYSTFLHEPLLIAMAYDLEQALNARQQPQLLGAITPIPNGGFCTGHQPQGKPHLPHGRFF